MDDRDAEIAEFIRNREEALRRAGVPIPVYPIDGMEEEDVE